MDLDCPEQPPSYYTFCLHSIAFFSFPINCLGCYLIICKSSHSEYKYRQLYLQIVSFIVENHMTWLGAGYYYYPMFGGYNTSPILSHVISPHTNVIGLVFVLAFELPSLVSCFQFRAKSAGELRPTNKISPYFTNFMTFIAHCFPFILSISIFLSEPSHEEQYEFISQHFPKCLHLLKNPDFIVYDWRTNLGWIIAAASAVIWVITFALYSLSLSIYTILTLHTMRCHMSATTYKIHRSALIALTFQCIIPFSCILAPISMIGIILLQELSQLQELATDLWFLIAAHSMASTIVMICFNSRYLDFVRTFFSRAFKINGVEVVSSSSNDAIVFRKYG